MRPLTLSIAALALLLGVAASLALDATSAMAQGRASSQNPPRDADLVPSELHSLRNCLAWTGDEAGMGFARVNGLLEKPAKETLDWLALFEIPDEPENLHRYLLHTQTLGLLKLCATLVSAWEGILLRWPRAVGDDDYRTHGMLRVSLDVRGTRREIPGVALAKLLSIPGLLPSTYYGGLLLRDAIIQGPLALNSMSVNIPLTFTDVVIKRGIYHVNPFRAGPVREPQPYRAISIFRSDFSKPLRFYGVAICGTFSIFESSFDYGLGIHDSQVDEENAESCDSESKFNERLFIQSSRFQRQLVVIDSSFDEVFIDSNELISINLSGSTIAYGLAIDNNVGFELNLTDSSLPFESRITGNQVEGKVYIDGNQISGEPDPVREAGFGRQFDLSVTSNIIGGKMTVSDTRLGDSVDPSEKLHLRLENNRVGSIADICMTGIANSLIYLNGSTFEGLLVLGLGRSKNDVLVEEATPDLLCAHQAGSWFLPDEAAGDGVSVIHMDGVSAGALRWLLPLREDAGAGHIRWSGAGLRFDKWNSFGSSGMGGQKASVVEELNHWRRMVADPSPQELNIIAEYLLNRGHFVAGRDVKKMAKRLNYWPCPPDVADLLCLWHGNPPESPSLGGSAAFASEETAPAEGAGEKPDAFASLEKNANDPMDDLSDLAKTVLQVATFVFLMPGGFGAKPEMALVWLLVGALVFGVLYWLYSWRVRERFREQILDRYLPRESLVREKLEQWKGMIASGGGWEKAAMVEGLERDVAKAPESWRRGDGGADPYQLAGAFRMITWQIRDNMGSEETERASSEFRRMEELFKEREAKSFGDSSVFGFSHFEGKTKPSVFSVWRYSFDAMLPVFSLHAYDSYYPESGPMRLLAAVQHVCGWWWSSAFLASVAIL